MCGKDERNWRKPIRACPLKPFIMEALNEHNGEADMILVTANGSPDLQSKKSN